MKMLIISSEKIFTHSYMKSYDLLINENELFEWNLNIIK